MSKDFLYISNILFSFVIFVSLWYMSSLYMENALLKQTIEIIINEAEQSGNLKFSIIKDKHENSIKVRTWKLKDFPHHAISVGIKYISNPDYKE